MGQKKACCTETVDMAFLLHHFRRQGGTAPMQGKLASIVTAIADGSLAAMLACSDEHPALLLSSDGAHAAVQTRSA
jgi:hypothetical protein